MTAIRSIEATRSASAWCAVALVLGLAVCAETPAQTASTVPANALARAYGGGWTCVYGYREERGACVAVVAPANGYVSESGADWECNRLYRKANDGCAAIVIPEHAFAEDSAYGLGWLCEQGYRETHGERCVAVQVPANAYASDSSYGSGWKCERGFVQTNDTCEPLLLPANAMLDAAGDGWT
jgi:hypothetical protein